MASIHLSLLGLLPISLHAAVLERLSSASESGSAYIVQESLWERLTAGGSSRRGGTVADEDLIRVRKTRLSNSPQTAQWTMQVHQKPEPIRTSGPILQRSLIEAPIAEGDPIGLVSSLGYRKRTEWEMRGERFLRGQVMAEVYQIYQEATSETPLDSNSYIISISTRSANPRPSNPHAPGGAGGTGVTPSAQELRAEAIARLEETRGFLRGLVDLGRVE